MLTWDYNSEWLFCDCISFLFMFSFNSALSRPMRMHTAYDLQHFILNFKRYSNNTANNNIKRHKKLLFIRLKWISYATHMHVSFCTFMQRHTKCSSERARTRMAGYKILYPPEHIWICAFVSKCHITVAAAAAVVVAAFVVAAALPRAAVSKSTEVFLHFILYKDLLLLATLLLPFMIWTVIIDDIGFLQSLRIFTPMHFRPRLFHRVYFSLLETKTD